MASQTSDVDLSNWKIPGRIMRNGVRFPGIMNKEDDGLLDRIAAGDVPEYEVLVATYLRSGTARLVEITWLLLHNCDIEQAKMADISQRHVFLEQMDSSAPGFKLPEPPVVAKTHIDSLTAQNLRKRKKKVIVGIRNPKDVLVSCYHFYRMNAGLGNFPGSWRQFFDFYRTGGIIYGDYFDNVLSWWKCREEANVLVVMYEDLNEEPLETISKIATFLEKEITEKALRDVTEWVSFGTMKNNPTTNNQTGVFKDMFNADVSPYMRKGTVGDWKNYFNEEESEYIDALCESRCKPVGLHFKFE